MTMRRFFQVLIFTFFLHNQSAFAIPILSFNNANADVLYELEIGQTQEVELWISGLEQDDLGGFDIALSFDDTPISLLGASLASTLTDFDITSLLTFSTSLSLFGVSFAPDLSAQGDAFLLASMTFQALTTGTGTLGYDSVLLSDAFAGQLDVQAFTASFNVVPGNVNTINAPGSFGLVLMSLLLLIRREKSTTSYQAH